MREIHSFNAEQLEPGMVLAADLRRGTEAAVLYTAGTVINERILNKILHLHFKEKILVYLPDIMDAEVVSENLIQQNELQEDLEGEQKRETHSGNELKEKVQDYINLKPENIGQQAVQLYNNVYATVKSFYQSASLNGEIDMKEAKTAASNISAVIIRDPQVLLQISVLKAIDNYTFSHAIYVAIYATYLARVLGFTEEELEQISLAGLLHDIGKVDVPLEILNKPDRLTPEEYTLIQEHVRYSFQIVYNCNDVNKNRLFLKNEDISAGHTQACML